MEIGRAFGAPSKDPKWVSKIALGVVLLWVPIVNLAVSGWGIAYVRNVYAGNENLLPEWSDFGTHWVKGLLFSIATVVYYAPVFIIIIAFGLPGMLLGNVQRNGIDGLGVALGSVLTGALVALLFAAAVSVLVQAARTHFAVHDSFASAFDLKEVLGAVRRCPGDYFLAWFAGIIAWVAVWFVGTLVGVVLGAIPCLGTLLLILLVPVLQGLGLTVGMGINAVYGQYASRAYPIGAPAPTPAAVSGAAPLQTSPTPPAPSPPHPVQPPDVRAAERPDTSPGLTGQAAVAAALAALGSREAVVSSAPVAEMPVVAASAPSAPVHDADSPRRPSSEAGSGEAGPEATPPMELDAPSTPTQELRVSKSEDVEAQVPEIPEEPQVESLPDPAVEIDSEKQSVIAPAPAPEPEQESVEVGLPEAVSNGDTAALDLTSEEGQLGEPDVAVEESSPPATESAPTPPAGDVPAGSRADDMASAALALERICEHGGTAERWILPRAGVRIGRGEECYVVLKDPKVSRVHAQLSQGEDGTVTIVDLSSSNGTFVGGKQLADEPVSIALHDEIRIGDCVLMLVRES